MSETIKVRCDLRNVLLLAAGESVTIKTALQMGLVPVLEKLARRAHEVSDPELEDILALLCL
jgi:hypothetical protein